LGDRKVKRDLLDVVLFAIALTDTGFMFNTVSYTYKRIDSKSTCKHNFQSFLFPYGVYILYTFVILISSAAASDGLENCNRQKLLHPCSSILLHRMLDL
jgi:hypothetical protein